MVNDLLPKKCFGISKPHFLPYITGVTKPSSWKTRSRVFYVARTMTAHYNDVIMTTMTYQITSLTVVYSTVYSDADQRKHQSSASLAFVWGIHRDRWIPRTKGQLRGKSFHLMTSSWDSPVAQGTGESTGTVLTKFSQIILVSPQETLIMFLWIVKIVSYVVESDKLISIGDHYKIDSMNIICCYYVAPG